MRTATAMPATPRTRRRTSSKPPISGERPLTYPYSQARHPPGRPQACPPRPNRWCAPQHSSPTRPAPPRRSHSFVGCLAAPPRRSHSLSLAGRLRGDISRPAALAACILPRWPFPGPGGPLSFMLVAVRSGPQCRPFWTGPRLAGKTVASIRDRLISSL